ncbi:MAG: hypothetical protein ACR2JH_05105, partial [Solirubrobacteraceae bacterium]
MARLLWAGVELLSVEKTPQISEPWSSDPLVTWAARLLAARHLIETAMLVTRRDPRPPRLVIAVDSLHAASMFAVALASRRLRRPPLAGAGVSCLPAAAAAGKGRRSTRGVFHHQ